MDQQLLRQDSVRDLVLKAAINDDRTFIEEWLTRGLTENNTTNEAFLNELLRKAAQHGSISVVELLAKRGK